MSLENRVKLPLAKVRIGAEAVCLDSANTVSRIACRGPRDSGNELEDLLYLFLVRSFDSNEIIIISPWLSPFELSRKLIYYPYITSRSVDEILRSLGTSETGSASKRRVFIGTRCFDFIDYQLLALALDLVKSGGRDRRNLVEYLRSSIEDLRSRVTALLRFGQVNGIEIRFDAEQKLHSKVYVNDFMGLLGSANFTYSGIRRNFECLFMVQKEEEAYQELKSFAEELLKNMVTYSSCEKSVLSFASSSIGLDLASMQELAALLDHIVKRLTL